MDERSPGGRYPGGAAPASDPGDELAIRLARYARVRLDPEPSTVRRARRAVVAEAWRAHLAATDPMTPAVHGVRVTGAGWSVRRAMLSLSAAVLAGLLVGTTVFAAARAGGPLYEVRQTLEVALLPGQPEARLQAELVLAQTRLAEALEAEAAGDTGALEAALAGYSELAERLQATSDARGTQRALEAVEFHQSVLAELRERVPEAARAGLSNALERSGAAAERLGSRPGGQGGQGGKPSSPPGRQGGAESSSSPGRSPVPDRTPPAPRGSGSEGSGS